MNYVPLPYQTLGTKWVLDRTRSALFAEMGLGKTAMTLDAIDYLMADGDCRAVLVVAPLRVATLQWPNEIRQWAKFRWMKVADLRTKEGWQALLDDKAHVYTINYEMLPRLAEGYCFNRRKFAFDTVIFDELSRCKAPRGKRIRSMKPYLPKLQRRIGLTGTPASNGYLDLWAQIALLDDGELLGRTFTSYQQRWFKSDYMGYNWELLPGAKEEIDSLVSRIALTLRASEFLDIPDTHTEIVEVSLPKEAMERYKTLEKESLLLLEETEVEALTAASLMNKLLQVAGGAVYDAERSVQVIHSEKIEALKALRRKHPKEPLLVATNYIHERERVLQAIPEARAWSDDLLGPWNAGKVPMIVADPRSIGHGLNLQAGGRIVVWYSPTWSLESFEQFNARVARKGQTRTPIVYRLIATDTADEAVSEAIRQKATEQNGLMNAVRALQRMRS